MRPSGSRSLATKFLFSTILLATAIAGFAYFQGVSVRPAGAANDAAGGKRFSPPADAVRPEIVSADDSPWLNLRSGKPVRSDYAGPESAISLFESGSLRPTTVIAADADLDGFADAVSGYSSGSGGVITLHRAAREAFAPESPETLAGIRRGEFPSSFEREAAAIDVPVSPDFLAAGRFRADSDLDIVVASRTSSEVYLIPVTGKGGFGTPVKFDVGGEVTAMASGTFDPAKSFAGIIFGTRGDGGFRLVIADGSVGFDNAKMRSIETAQPADSLILANPDGVTLGKDVFILGGGQLSRITAVGKNSAAPESIDLPVSVRDVAAGEFIRDRRAKTELAVLGENGVVYYFKNGPIDTRPFTEAEIRAEFARSGRGRTRVAASTDNESSLANDWSIAEESDLGIINPARETAAPMLVRARVTGNETDDLIVIDPSANKVRLLFKEPNYDADRTSFTGPTREGDLAAGGSIAAVVPMRLNVMGQQGITMLESGKLEPTPVLFTPQATFTVTKTADTADGVCNADCSLREAVTSANGAAGADLITFGLSGTHQLTIAGGNENTAATGDLDITQATTITGNGSLNTILQAGSTSSNGIDKVMSINPTFTSAFATSITGVTIRNGRNQSSFAGDGFGGGFDWEGSGTGTISVTNSEVSTNSTLDGDGGGIVATNSVAGTGAVTISSCVISSNTPARTGGSSPFGGGIFVGTGTPFFISTAGVASNSVNGSGGQGQGGGIFAFGPGGTGGNSSISGTTVTSNTAPSDAGGLYSTQRVDIQALSNFASNTSGRFGGAIFINHSNTTSSITKSTIRINSATTTGSGIYLGSTTTANVLNVSFSRIVNNTGGGLKGLATAGGTAIAENNWWGCATTPTAGPCDTVGTTGSGSVDADPWLQLRLTASPTTVTAGQTSSLTASFLLNSAGSAIAASNLDTIIGNSVAWSATLGTISGSQASIQSNGTATATYNATTPGAGTATATVDNGPATANITVNAASADLSITKTDGATTEIPGTSVTYTITASNAGPSGVTGATVADTFPASISGVTWTCVGAGGGTCTAAGSGNISDTVNLPAGGSVTFTAVGNISASATGSLSNTATVSSSVTDPNSGNNSATDTDTLTPQANLGITKTDGVTTVTAGGSTTYTITASNVGPSNAPGSTVADTFPAVLTGTWTCVGAGGGTCTAAGSGNINDTVNLPAGGSVTYTVSASISASATGSLSNTATVATGGGVTDPTPGNNSATDTDTITASADLAITKTDGATTEVPGTSVTYTITASNAGPSNASGSTVADTFPATITGVTWTCVGAGGGTCTASGSGNISDTVNLPAGGSVTYTATGTISASATGSLANTATVAAPGGVTDPTPGNNSATDTDTLTPQANLGITKTDGVTTVTAGGSTTYTITASNAGPSNAPGSTVADTFPAVLTGTWTCVGAGGGTCTASGSGNINDTVNLPAGGSVTYTVSASISAAATGSLSNTATVAAGGGVTDPTPGNNSATDTDTITASADLAITKTNGVTSVTAGTSTTYTITASNAGPSNVTGATVADTFPAIITGASWTCVGAGGGSCSATGLGNISDTVNIPVGGSVTYTASGTISPAATGTLSNTATVSSSVTDPTPANNSATDTDTIIPSDTVPPTAVSTPAGVNTAGGSSYVFQVTYADNTAINVSTLDSNDVIVTGPSAFSAPATFVTVDNNTNGTPRTATYSITPPGGTWDAADNGVYSVVMQASQVSDTIGNFVLAGTLGTFQVLPLNLTVDRTDDTAAANACTAAANDCSLRGAISRANTAATNDTINFDPVVFATPQTILLGNTELVLNNAGTINIVGPGADKVTIDGNNASRILVNSTGLVATVSGIRFTKGNGVGTTNTGRGGAIYNTGGNLTMNGVIINGNAAANGGGFNTAGNGTTTFINSWIFGNTTTGSGGAGQNFSGSTLNIINTSITGNTSASTTVGGGGIQANGTVFVTNSTIGGNTATGGSGGGIFYNGANLTITNSTIAGNTSTNNGGGIHASVATGSVRNSIIAGNNGTPTSVDATGTWVSNGNNIIGVVGLSGGWVGSDLQNTDPLLAPLGYYGGNGLTFALTSLSPAINAAQGCVLTLTCSGTNPAAAITLDQRGAARVGAVDIGAFELNNSANGGSYVAVLPSGLQNSPYSYQLTANNGPFIQVVTNGTLPNGIVLSTAAAPETATSLAGTPTVFGVFNFGVTSSSGANFNLTNYTLTVFAAAGSPVFIEGRLTDTSGQPVRNASVVLTDTGVLKRTTLTSPLGYYRFENVPAGPGYTIGVSSKRYTFTPVNFTANLNITGLDLVGTPLP